MGVDGLLKTLRTAELTRAGSFADEAEAWRGKTAVIDGHSWLHKAIYGCARRVAGLDAPFRDSPAIKHPEKFAMYVLHRLGLLVHYGIHPVVVFDGCRLGAKKATNAARREGRAKLLEEGRAVWRQANELYRRGGGANKQQASRLYDQCEKILQRCVSVTQEVVQHTIRMMQRKGRHGGPFEFIVAPYEADSQMAYQCKVGKADLVISEDSDCLAYLAAAGMWDPHIPPLITKMDRNGTFVEVHLGDLLRKSKGRGARSFAGRLKAFVVGGVGGDRATGSCCSVENSTALVSADIGAMSVKALRSELKKRGELVSGNKAALVQRLELATKVDGSSELAGKGDRDAESDVSHRAAPSANAGLGPRGFIQMCVLAGCDYVDSIKGIGVVKAQSLVVNARGALNDSRIRKIVRLQLSIKSSKYTYRDGTQEHWNEYADNARLAELTFLHHIVYDADSKQCVHLNPLDEDAIINSDGEAVLKRLKKMLGAVFESGDARRIAEGTLNPRVLGKLHAPELEHDSPEKVARRSAAVPAWAVAPRAAPAQASSLSSHANKAITSKPMFNKPSTNRRPMFNKAPSPKPSPSLHGNAFLAQLIASKSSTTGNAKSSRDVGPQASSMTDERNGIAQDALHLPASPSARVPSARCPPSEPQSTNLASMLDSEPVVSSGPIGPAKRSHLPRPSGAGKDSFAQYSTGPDGLYVVSKPLLAASEKGNRNGAKKKRLSKNPFSLSVRHARTPAVHNASAATPGTTVAVAGFAGHETNDKSTDEDSEKERANSAISKQAEAVSAAVLRCDEQKRTWDFVDLSTNKANSTGPTAAERMKAREARKRSAEGLCDGAPRGAKRRAKKAKGKNKPASSLLSFFKKKPVEPAPQDKSVEIVNVGI